LYAACACALVAKSPQVFVGQFELVLEFELVSPESEQEIENAIIDRSENKSIVIFLCFMFIALVDKLKM